MVLDLCCSDHWGAFSNLTDLLCSCQIRRELQLSGVNVITTDQIFKAKYSSGSNPIEIIDESK